MEVQEESQVSLTVNTHQGLYRCTRLICGITSAPAIWQRSMDQILEGTSCILDDMIITGKRCRRTSLLELVNYYHKFLPNLATTLNPLNGLLKQGKPWKWSAVVLTLDRILRSQSPVQYSIATTYRSTQ